MLTAKILFIIFYLCIPVIFFDFLDLTAAAAGSFLRYLDRGPKELFLATNRGVLVKKIFKLKTLPPKSFKIHSIVTKDSKIQWIGFSRLIVPSPKCTFLPSNCEKTNINIAEKHLPVLHIVIQMLLIQMFIYSTILRKDTYK
jgi:hypothetical protein